MIEFAMAHPISTIIIVFIVFATTESAVSNWAKAYAAKYAKKEDGDDHA